MSDLPTRDDIMHHLVYDITAIPSTKARRHMGEVLTAFANGDLLTREEAANDPEVQQTVFDNWQVRQAWGVTDDE